MDARTLDALEGGQQASAGSGPSSVYSCELSTFCIQSGDITQHLASLVKFLLGPLHRWPAVEALFARIAGG